MKQSIATPSAPDSGEQLRTGERARLGAARGELKRRERDLAAAKYTAAEQYKRLVAALARPGRGFARLRAAVELTCAELAFSGSEGDES